MIAAGAGVDLEALPIPEQEGMLVTAADVANGKVKVGQKVVVLGGGKIGLTLTEALKQEGKEVTVVEKEKRIAGDVIPAWKWRHTSWVEQLKIKTLTLSKATKIGSGGVTVINDKGVETFVEADTVIAASPRKSNQELFQEFEFMVDELHGAGDALIPRGLLQAIHEGYRLGVRI